MATKNQTAVSPKVELLQVPAIQGLASLSPLIENGPTNSPYLPVMAISHPMQIQGAVANERPWNLYIKEGQSTSYIQSPPIKMVCLGAFQERRCKDDSGVNYIYAKVGSTNQEEIEKMAEIDKDPKAETFPVAIVAAHFNGRWIIAKVAGCAMAGKCMIQMLAEADLSKKMMAILEFSNFSDCVTEGKTGFKYLTPAAFKNKYATRQLDQTELGEILQAIEGHKVAIKNEIAK